MVEWWLQALLWILPAYAGNMAPVLVSHSNLFGLRRPIDGGRTAPDGNRLLGDGKTWQGLLAAVAAGGLVGLLLDTWGYSTLQRGALLGLAAILGDLAGSFSKRRLGLTRGANAGLLDSMDFITAALLAALPMYPWEFRQIALLVVANPLLHRAANVVGYHLRLKDVPW